MGGESGKGSLPFLRPVGSVTLRDAERMGGEKQNLTFCAFCDFRVTVFCV